GRPVRTPCGWRIAFVPTVVPWAKKATASGGTAPPKRSRTPSTTARAGSAGVEGSLRIANSRDCSSKNTKSENVPPVSTPIRTRLTARPPRADQTRSDPTVPYQQPAGGPPPQSTPNRAPLGGDAAWAALPALQPLAGV